MTGYVEDGGFTLKEGNSLEGPELRDGPGLFSGHFGEEGTFSIIEGKLMVLSTTVGSNGGDEIYRFWIYSQGNAERIHWLIRYEI